MTFGRGHIASHTCYLDGAAVSHSAELVRGDSLAKKKGPLIRPSGTFSPRGEGTLRHSQKNPSEIGQPRARVGVPR